MGRTHGKARIAALALALSSALGVAVAGPARAQDLVLDYPLDENAGTWAFDQSGNDLDAPLEDTVDYGAPAWGPGFFGSALVFDGVDDALNAGDDPLLDLDHYTLMAWVRYEETSERRQEVLEKVDSYWMNIRQGTRKLRVGGFYGGCTSANWVFLDSGPIVPENTWTHVASTYDGATLRIYIDGQPAGSAAVSGTVCANANPLVIGAKHSPIQGVTTAFFNGSIDEVRLFSRALSEPEIQFLRGVSVPALPALAHGLTIGAIALAGPAALRARGSRRA